MKRTLLDVCLCLYVYIYIHIYIYHISVCVYVNMWICIYIAISISTSYLHMNLLFCAAHSWLTAPKHLLGQGLDELFLGVAWRGYGHHIAIVVWMGDSPIAKEKGNGESLGKSTIMMEKLQQDWLLTELCWTWSEKCTQAIKQKQEVTRTNINQKLSGPSRILLFQISFHFLLWLLNDISCLPRCRARWNVQSPPVKHEPVLK